MKSYTLFLGLLIQCSFLLAQAPPFFFSTVSDSTVDRQLEERWEQISTLSRDTTATARQQRQETADRFWAYFMEHPREPTGVKAAFLSFNCWQGNKAWDRMIAQFEGLSLDNPGWPYFVYFYRRAHWDQFGGHEQLLEKLQALEPRVSTPLARSVVYDAIGFSLYWLSDWDGAERYYQQVLDLNVPEAALEIRNANRYLAEIRALEVGKIAPDFTVNTLDGREIQLADLRGKVVLLDFWATWCGPCLAQMPDMKELYEKFRDRDDFVLLGISLDTDPDQAKAYLAEANLPWPQICDGQGRESPMVFRYGASHSIPKYYILDKTGVIRYNQLSNNRGEDMRRLVEELLK